MHHPLCYGYFKTENSPPCPHVLNPQQVLRSSSKGVVFCAYNQYGGCAIGMVPKAALSLAFAATGECADIPLSNSDFARCVVVILLFVSKPSCTAFCHVHVVHELSYEYTLSDWRLQYHLLLSV